MEVVMRYDTGYRKPKVTFHETAKPPRRFEGRFPSQDYIDKQAAEAKAAEPALTESALMDENIRRYDQQKAQEKASKLRKEEKRIAADKWREQENARVVAEVAAAKAARAVAEQKAQAEKERDAAFREIDEALQRVNATDDEIRQVRETLKQNDGNRLSKTAWLAGLLELRMNEGRMK